MKVQREGERSKERKLTIINDDGETSLTIDPLDKMTNTILGQVTEFLVFCIVS